MPSMHIGLQSWGTEGDLRPFLTLSRALLQRGHRVELVFTGVEGKDLSPLARSVGVPTRFVDEGYFATHQEELGLRARENLRHGDPRQQLERILKDVMDPVEDAIWEASRDLAERCDVLVGSSVVPAPAVAAEARGRPFVQLALQPLVRSAYYPPSGAPSLGRLGNRLLWWVAEGVLRKALLHRVNRLRARCGLAAIQRFSMETLGRPRRTLVAVSPSLFPRPPDWPAHVLVSGALDLREPAASWAPAPALQAFLAAGPPVFLSFGSMLNLDQEHAQESVEILAEAVALAGVRGVVQAPPAVIATAPRRPDLYYLERAPHQHLFPLCSAIVHHGGAGTTQSALLAGRGSVVVPYVGDQFYWGDLLHARGVASAPLRRRSLTPKGLAARIRAVLDDPAIAARAGTLAQTLRAEDGATATAELVEQAAR